MDGLERWHLIFQGVPIHAGSHQGETCGIDFTKQGRKEIMGAGYYVCNGCKAKTKGAELIRLDIGGGKKRTLAEQTRSFCSSECAGDWLAKYLFKSYRGKK
jgi:hypothetical protein